MKDNISKNEIPDHLFRVISYVTVYKLVHGRKRKFKNIPLDWEAKRETPLVAPEDVFAGEVTERGKDYLTAFFSGDEALTLAYRLLEKNDMNEVRLIPSFLPFELGEERDAWRPTSYKYDIGGQHLVMSLDVKGMTVVGRGRYGAAKEEEWAEEMKTTTLELPERIADRLESKEDPGQYLSELEQKAQINVSEMKEGVDKSIADMFGSE